MLGLLTIGSYLEDLPPFFYLFYCKKKSFFGLKFKSLFSKRAEFSNQCNVFIGTEKNSELHLKNYIFWKDRATHGGVLIAVAVKKDLCAVEILSSTILRVYTVSA